jgi:trimethylamine--corrinoid protein Co-methyltransferase
MQALQFLSPDEVEAIHQATLHILSRIGIVLSEPGGRERLQAAGALLRGERVLLPPELLHWALEQCPPQVRIRGRGGNTTVLGDGRLHWHNLGGAKDVYEHTRQECRPALVQDVIDSARLLDALPEVDTVTPFFTPQDVPGQSMSLAMYRYTLPHTIKPIHGPGVQTAEEVRLAVGMAEVIGPPSETLTFGISPVSPLLLPDDVVQAVMAAAEFGVPIGPLPCPTAGATAPLSMAGALAQQNAEVLATVVLAQVTKPGVPIFYCGRLAMMEPRTGMSVWGGAEMGMVSAGTVQLAHFYKLPVNVYGLSTNAQTLNLQSGYERALNAVLPALAGADELSGIGEMQAGVSGSFAQMVADDEIAAVIRRIRRGFTVDADALAVEVISEVMEGSRNYLDQLHTVKYLRAGEVLMTQLADRGGWDEWVRKGRVEMAGRAQAKAEQILASHEVAPLSDEQERALDEIFGYAQEVE